MVPIRGKLLEQGAGVFVATVFGPHDPKHAQFRFVGMATEPLQDHLVFIGFEAFGGNFGRGEGGWGGRDHGSEQMESFQIIL
jgi:hypothetical protein